MPNLPLAPRAEQSNFDQWAATCHALEAAGIPYFVSEFEESMTTFDSLQIQLETFVENVLFD